MFFTLAENILTAGCPPPNPVKFTILLITSVPGFVSKTNAALRQISALFPRFYPARVTRWQQSKMRNVPKARSAFSDSFSVGWSVMIASIGAFRLLYNNIS
jgi:hypothetical protein